MSRKKMYSLNPLQYVSNVYVHCIVWLEWYSIIWYKVKIYFYYMDISEFVYLYSELFEEMQHKTQKYARLPNRYLYRWKISLIDFYSKTYLPKIIL